MPDKVRPLILIAIIIALAGSLPAWAASPGSDSPLGVTGDFNGTLNTGGSYDPYTGNAKRVIDDLMVTGGLGTYPLKWSRTLNSRYGSSPASFGNGGTWQHSYQWSLTVFEQPPPPSNPSDPPYDGPLGWVYYPDGRTLYLGIENTTSYWQANGWRPTDQLGGWGADYTLRLHDGGMINFHQPNGQSSGSFRATQIVDPYGLVTNLTYDSSGRLWKITEPGGRYLQITYTTFSYPYSWPPPGGTKYTDVISKVQVFPWAGAPVSEEVNYSYTTVTVNAQLKYYNLTQATYADGGTATYTYFAEDPVTLCQAVSTPVTISGMVER